MKDMGQSGRPARIFSREVEHSEETLEILEDDISFDEAFHVKHLLGQI